MHTCAMNSQLVVQPRSRVLELSNESSQSSVSMSVSMPPTRVPTLFFKIRVWRRGSLEADADADSPPTIRSLTPDGGTREKVENLVFSKIVSLETGRATSAARYILLGDRKPLQRPMTHCPRSATCIAAPSPSAAMPAVFGACSPSGLSDWLCVLSFRMTWLLWDKRNASAEPT
jgi:hypothetical protein